MDKPVDTKEQAREALSSLTKEQVASVLSYLGDITKEAVAKTLPDVVGPLLTETLKPYGFTDEIAGLVQLLAARSGDNREDTLKKALTLYGLALGARERGNRLAILNPDDEIVQEIIGFEIRERQPVA